MLHDEVLLGIGTIGVPVIWLMLIAIGSRRKNGHFDRKATVILISSALYALCALFFYLAEMSSEYAKFPGLMAIAVIALMCILFLSRQEYLLISILAVMGAGATAMIMTPAVFWRGNAFDLIETVYIDNSSELPMVRQPEVLGSERQLLQLSDGSVVLQFERGETKIVGSLYAGEPPAFATFQTFASGMAGQWFEVSHFELDPQFRRARYSDRAAPRYSLLQRNVDIYSSTGQQSIGVLLNQEAELDFETLLQFVLAWSDAPILKDTLLRVGDIDVNEPGFIDAAFENSNAEAYRFLVSAGIDEKATASNGQTLLHRVAYVGDVQLMRSLVDRGASLTMKNNQGFTPLQVFREIHGRKSDLMQALEDAF